jgi:hypothetical protein
VARAGRIAYNYGFSDKELNRIADITRKHEAELSKAWHDYFRRSDDNDSGGEGRGVTDRALVVQLRDGRVGSADVVPTAGRRIFA